MLLNGNKPKLLAQVKNLPKIEVSQLVQLLDTYEDLHIADFKDIISDLSYSLLEDAVRDPQEKELWNNIQAAPENTPQEVQQKQQLTASYMQQYPGGPKIDEARTLAGRLQKKLVEFLEELRKEEERLREQNDWMLLDRNSYPAMQAYRIKYPASVHLDELDDQMWAITRKEIAAHTLNRYLADWPGGRHAAEARQAINDIAEWEEVRQSRDIFRVNYYRRNHPDTPFKEAVDTCLEKLKNEELAHMMEAPEQYSKEDVMRFIESGIFTQWDFMQAGLISEKSWERLFFESEALPDLRPFQTENPNLQAPDGCTDIYLFGTPGTGKTCLLMGLAGANGDGYALNMRREGGPYASALQQYVNAGITPGSTVGTFVTVINGYINETDKRGKVRSHHINLVEMSGEEFARRIANHEEVTLAHMGTGATNLMRNNNRKAFFIIVDPTSDLISTSGTVTERDEEGNTVYRVGKKYLSQLDILNKFVSLFELPENRDIMEKVDAIHFVVTKADTLGHKADQLDRATQLLTERYRGPVAQLKEFCRRTKRINLATDYRPYVFTFSLGKFYLGDIFDFDPEDTLQIVDTLRSMTRSTRERSWWDKVQETFG
ncbi:MAG: hypothetical protein J1E02_03880 [Coprobacter sp.]|nr:hypothetical protein [Coprobacter sp.]